MSEAPRLDFPPRVLNIEAGCQCPSCRARRRNAKHPNRDAVYVPCLCSHTGYGEWQVSPSCPYHGAAPTGEAEPHGQDPDAS